MMQQRTGANVLKREVAVTVREHAAASADRVFHVLTDVSAHVRWGGAEASTLLSVNAPAGPATAGTEFSSTAEDAICWIKDSSVVTEAVPPLTFEKVTDSGLENKKTGTPADWLVVHRYEIQPDGGHSNITYTTRIVRASALPGRLAVFGIPVLRRLAALELARASKAGLRRLAAAAETSARA
jgi:hypothetical protein